MANACLEAISTHARLQLQYWMSRNGPRSFDGGSYPSSFEIKDWCKWASRGYCCSLLHSYTRVPYNISIGVDRQCKQRSQSEEVYHPKAHLQLAIRGDRMRSLTHRSREQLQVVV
ncbi:hypothetical protein IFM89_031363 [Coptis chinensis]|uniref:Uncharacterized protein n=1 Tax=Coptis chinensis TaxID=261450 RepID=A0A835IY46_9MAGN|nr:hypothetical protein IFM89_031363 [Coptis chinensis]